MIDLLLHPLQNIYFPFFYMNFMDIYPIEVLSLIDSINIEKMIAFFQHVHASEPRYADSLNKSKHDIWF